LPALLGIVVLVALSAVTAPSVSATNHSSGDPSKAAPNRLEANLNGAKEVPGPGDSNGRGHAVIRLRPAAHKVCVNATWSRIGRPIAAHIHRGGPKAQGPVVIDLSTAVTGGAHCKGGVPTRLINRLKAHPGRFYFNIHTVQFQGGAIRGQLHR
jgi:hypothetical protein